MKRIVVGGGVLLLVVVATASPARRAVGLTPTYRTVTAYVVNGLDDTVTPIDISTNTPGTPIPVGHDPLGIAITPDGAIAYVAGGDTVTPIDTATNTAETAIFVPGSEGGLWGIAITPNGKTVYVVDQGGCCGGLVTPIDTATNTVGTPIEDPYYFPTDVAISPDGKTAYVTNYGGGLLIIDTATNTVRDDLALGRGPGGMSITPDGKTLYVADAHRDNAVLAIDTATNMTCCRIPVGKVPYELAMTADGATGYAANGGSGTVTPFDVATNTPGSPIHVGIRPFFIAFTSISRTAYVTNAGDGTVTPIDTVTNTPGAPIRVGNEPAGIAIVPDQAPVARLAAVSATKHGQPAKFDASASFGVTTAIKRYVWSFGDGQTASTIRPTITHTYKNAGNYTARLTVIDAAFTSTARVFTGQSVIRNGGPGASLKMKVKIT